MSPPGELRSPSKRRSPEVVNPLASLRRIASSGAVGAAAQTLVANLLILALNAATGIITARLLGPDGRGEQAAMILWPQFLAFALTLGLPSALLYNLRRHPERGPQLFLAALMLGALMGALAAAVGALVIPLWLAEEYPAQTVRFARWAMLLAPVALLSLVFSFALQAREEYALFNAARYLTPLLTLVALVGLALFGLVTPESAALAYLLPVVPVFVWMLGRLWRAYRPSFGGVRGAMKSLTGYGVRSYGIDLLGQFSQQLDRVLVVGILSPALMGLYVVALSLAQMLNVFQAAAVAVLFPKASGRGAVEAAGLAGRAARASTALSVLGAVGLGVFSPWALGLLYGEEYLEAVPVFRLLLFAMVFGGARWVLAQAFLAANRPGTVTVLQILGLCLTLPLLLVLVPLYGLEGVGVALLISQAVRFMLVFVSFPLVLKVRAPRLWLNRGDIADIVTAFRRGREKS